jgi:hypothetical protein
VIIPDTVIGIGGGAFQYNNELANVTIPNSVTEIKMSAFEYCGLTSIILPNRIEYIQLEAFSHNKLTEITFPVSVKVIESDAFSYNQITSLTIPNTIMRIEGSAFENNPIATLVIPSSLSKNHGIDYGVFSGCPLIRITLPENMDEENLKSFPEGFVNFWKSNDKKAGTYVKRGPIWSME